MKNVSKMIRDHKRLVLGNTGKCLVQNKSKENIDFQNLLRSHSYNPKGQPDPSHDPPLKKRRLSATKVDPLLTSHHQTSEKPRTGQLHPHSKHFTSFHIQKREKLTLNSLQNTPPQGPKCKEAFRPKPIQPLFETSGPCPLDGHVLEMLGHLRQHSIVSTSGESHYVINKEHLRELLSNVLGWVVNGQSHEVNSRCTCPQLNKILIGMLQKIDKDVRQSRRKRLRVDKNTVEVQISQQTDALAKLCQSKILKLTQEQHKLEQEVEKLSRYEQNIKSECKYSQALIEKLKRELQQLHQSTQREQGQLYLLKSQVREAEVQYSRLVESENRVRNFVTEQQNNKIIKEILGEYKQIEADIYEYAAYLQSNQLASDLFYEPHPFRAVEAQIEEELKNVNVAIMQGRDRTVEEKCVAMRDFVLDSMGKFRRKDEEMGRVIEFRTKCIQKFIEHMKRWLNNWQFKQEFLVNLRKEFAYDSTALLQLLEPATPATIDQASMRKIKELTKKIVENYQFGNTFY